MYIEKVKLKFLDTILQSEQMNYLSEISNALEQVSILNTKEASFSIDINSNRIVKIVIWNPSIRNVFWTYIAKGYSKQLFEVITPKDFDKFYTQYNP